ncbi:MAG TPA: class I adenylate-forming enzyme family protein [Frankiaceae bacterium]|nr:class I adenylate-forming enzyme family protein [Frankiaceae bacterium]
MSVLGRTLREAAGRFGDRVALVHAGRELTYAETDRLTDELAAGLAAWGVKAGDLVALALPGGMDYVLGFTALSRLDAVTTGLNPRYTTAERAKVIARAAPALVIASSELLAELPAGSEVLSYDADPKTPALDLWDEIRLAGAAPPAGSDSDDLALPETVVFTSGTTGLPKGALFNGTQIAAIAAFDTGGAWGTGGPQLVATGLPHVGFMTKLAGYFQLGATLHILDRWRAADALRVLATERVPVIGGVAAQVSLLMHHPDFPGYDWSAVKALIIGAGPSPAALVREARERFGGAGYSVRYSLTESGGVGTLTALDAPESETLGSVGRPRPGTELEIRDPDTDAPLGPDEIGRVCLRSPAVMAGYWRDPEASAAALDGDGWLRTGDLGYVGGDGLLRITGRIGEMYIRGGYNVFPLEVESVLLEHPAVGSVAIAPQDSSVMGQIGVAVVVPDQDHEPPALETLRAFAAEKLAAYKLPEAMLIVEALPLTSMDKLDRKALAELAAEAKPERQ